MKQEEPDESHKKRKSIHPNTQEYKLEQTRRTQSRNTSLRWSAHVIPALHELIFSHISRGVSRRCIWYFNPVCFGSAAQMSEEGFRSRRSYILILRIVAKISSAKGFEDTQSMMVRSCIAPGKIIIFRVFSAQMYRQIHDIWNRSVDRFCWSIFRYYIYYIMIYI